MDEQASSYSDSGFWHRCDDLNESTGDAGDPHKLNEQALAKEAFAKLHAQQAEIDAQRIELSDGRRAAALADIETVVQQRDTEALQAEQERDHARQHYDIALDTRSQMREALTLAEQRAPEIEQARQQQARLQEISQRTEALEEAYTRLANAEKQLQDLAKAQHDLDGALEAAEVALQVHEQAVLKSREVAAQVDTRQLRFEHADRLYQQRERLEAVLMTLAATERDAHIAAEHHSKTVAAYEEAQQNFEQIEHAWYAGQAGVLAMQLTAGSPCPVCGSREHPHLAVTSPDIPTETILKGQRAALRKQEKVQQDAFKILTEKQRALAETRAAQMAHVAALGDQHDSALDALRETLRQATDGLEAARAAQTVLPQQEQAQRDSLGIVEKLKEQLASLELTYKAATTEAATAQAVLIERERSIPEHLRTREAIERAITGTENVMRQLTAALEQARKQTTDAENEVASAESAWTTRMEASNQTRQRAHEQQLAFVERLAAEGFTDHDLYSAAKRTADVLRLLDQHILTFDQDLAIAINRLTGAVKAVEGLAAPDLETLIAASDQARKSYEDALQRQAALSEQLAQYVAWCDEAEQLSVVQQQLQHRYQVTGEIANIANGDNAYRMSFHRFVLAALLDQVLINASHRLQAMSRGRYTLQRALDQHDRRSAGGLELEVLDLFTGRARLAKTLSGGESFLASLALALGLADVVQARTGGIYLETMFVDEGFGSLDERMLDQAIQTLSNLQHGGRIVGIISHVTELQRRIAARLEVTSSPSGSTATFVIGSTS